MRIEIDQSGKIEYTNKITVIAYSNGKRKSILIKSDDKRKLEKIYRTMGKPNMFVYQTFGILIFLLIKKEINQINQIIVDCEYVGKENLIKTIIKRLMIRSKVDFDVSNIHFQRVGKKSGSHIEAIEVYRRRKKSDYVVKFSELLKYLI